VFEKLGLFISRRWQYIVAVWLILLVGLFAVAPRWEDVTQDGEFAFLPADSESRQAEAAFAKAFPKDALSSQVFVVVRRTSNSKGLNKKDKEFVKDVLIPRLTEAVGFQPNQDIGDELADEGNEADESDPANRNADEQSEEKSQVLPIVASIQSRETPGIELLFESYDNKATLIKIDLRNEFLSQKNHPTIEAVESLLHDLRYEKTAEEPDEDDQTEVGDEEPAADEGEGNQQATKDDTNAGQVNRKTKLKSVVPAGLDLSVSGNATFGRDMVQAQLESGEATELWTRILVIVLLLLIYRAPVLAMMPLITVALATAITRKLLSIMAAAGWIDLFSGINPYVTVVVYGAGVDYCLFLIARYKEELDGGGTMDEAIVSSMSKVGAALTASAGTVMCGIGMMVFAEFGKFQQAGVAITFGLFIVLLASLTFTPAMLRLAGRWAFWPNSTTETIEGDAGWVARSSLMNSIRDRNIMQNGWIRVGQLVMARPATLWMAAAAIMLPFAIIGVLFFNHLSYGLLSELPDTSPSVRGTSAVRNHFPDGEIGPLKVLIRKEGIDFLRRETDEDGTSSLVPNRDARDLVERLTDTLASRMDDLGIAKIRSWTEPTGLPKHPREDEFMASLKAKLKKEKRLFRGLASRNAATMVIANRYYVSQVDPSATRIDVIPVEDPFSRDSIAQFNEFQRKFAEALPEGLQGAEVSFVGATASVADLKTVTDRDTIRIDILVLAGVFLILVALLRRPMISMYLIVSVFFSYLATLGLTFAVFWAMDPAGFSGLDWKVPIFLFTILIAVGEDYNIFLITRIDEESEKHGPIKGITVALEKTGSIISSCGIIMAGTFASLLAGSLVGMDQLGFALATGVLLDTFVVRPILVPAYLIMLHSGRFGKLGKFLGAGPTTELATMETT
jgi:RND superfamily putative drug exporter